MCTKMSKHKQTLTDWWFNFFLLKEWIEVEFIIKTMYSEYVYHVCLKDRKGTMWNNDACIGCVFRMEQHIGELIAHYGYFGIIIALAGGIVGLPIPDEFYWPSLGITFQKELCQELPRFKWDGWCDVRDYIKLHTRLKTWTSCFKKYGPKIRIKEHHIEKHMFYLKNMVHFF